MIELLSEVALLLLCACIFTCVTIFCIIIYFPNIFNFLDIWVILSKCKIIWVKRFHVLARVNGYDSSHCNFVRTISTYIRQNRKSMTTGHLMAHGNHKHLVMTASLFHCIHLQWRYSLAKANHYSWLKSWSDGIS